MNRTPQSDSVRPDPRNHLIQQLRRQLGRWEAAPAEDTAIFSSGTTALDRLLPGGGLRPGMLVEWLTGHVVRGLPAARTTGEPLVTTFHCGAVTLSLLNVREACREGGTLVVIDRQQAFYPPAAAAWGIDLDRLILVHPRTARDELWAVAQSLRSPAVAAVWATIDRLESHTFRQLQLAAQAGRALGLLLRPASVRGQPSWADVRLAVEKSSAESRESRAGIPTLDYRLVALDSVRPVQVRVLRLRGGRAGGTALLEIDDAAHAVWEVNLQHGTHPLPVVTELADATPRSRSARA